MKRCFVFICFVHLLETLLLLLVFLSHSRVSSEIFNVCIFIPLYSHIYCHLNLLSSSCNQNMYKLLTNIVKTEVKRKSLGFAWKMHASYKCTYGFSFDVVFFFSRSHQIVFLSKGFVNVYLNI